ncbi:MAG TPA: polysaccharide biosynthesis tyrosine autokinase [Candidatus Limnocylindrales bacterium]|nr:polysaccharide biosynthesis tyrosine autokinase [Candidatus Limnocylindrales bacterium]
MENLSQNNHNVTNAQLTTPAIDLLAPMDRFTATSRLYVRLHRHQLLVRKYWWVLLLMLGLTVLPAYLLTRALPRTYQSEARLWLTGKLDLSEGRLYTEELVNFLGTQADLLRSRAIQERALAKVEQQLPKGQALKPVPGVLDVIRSLVSAPAAKKAAEEFPFRLKVSESSKSSILELRATGTEPNSTQLFLKELMAQYLSFKREIREGASDRAVASLAKQVNSLASDLKGQQERMYAFQLTNNVVFLQEQGSGAGSYLAQLSRQLATLQTELQLLQSVQPEQWVELGSKPRSAVVGQPPPGEGPAQDLMAGLTGPHNDLLRAAQQAQLLKAKREELGRVLRPMHPKILKFDEDIAAQEKLMEIARDEIRQQLINRRQALQLEVNNLQKSFDQWEGKTLQASRKMVDYDRLRQDVQRTQAAYDKLLSVISTVDVGKSVDQENVSVLEQASVALPVRHMFRYLGLALGMALILSGAILWIFGKLDDRFASQTELAEEVSERVIGQVLDVQLRQLTAPMGREILSTQRFEFMESFRSIRSALWFMDPNGSKPKTILIASAVPQEGKSTVALYLASTMAIGGSRVLLIDGDMRRSKLHQHLGVPSSPGLAEILNREATPREAIVTTSLDNLSFLPAGVPNLQPGELVLRSQWDWLLKEAGPHFDYILIDSPPVLAADDAMTLASRVDGTLFVVRGSFTSARLVRDALDALRQRRARVLGLIFNRAITSVFAHYPYQRYRNEYRWQAA